MTNPIIFLVQLALFVIGVRSVQLYSSQSHLCCRGSVYAIPKNHLEQSLKYYCCGSTLVIHPKYEVPLCCQDTLYENTSTNQHACCGNNMYDTVTHTCLNQVDVISVPQENTWERLACGKSKDNVTLYSKWRHLCCSGVLHTKEIDVQCCGESVYNETASLCCDGHVAELEEPWSEESRRKNDNWGFNREWECCGKLAYNSTKQQCCNNKVVDKPVPTTEIYDCCGHELTTDRKLICVGDHWEVRKDPKGMYNVCGGQLFDERWRRGKQKVCHNDTIIELGYREAICAVNGEAVKYVVDKNKLCCPSQIVDLSEEDKANTRYSCCDESIKFEPPIAGYDQMPLPGRPQVSQN